MGRQSSKPWLLFVYLAGPGVDSPYLLEGSRVQEDSGLELAAVSEEPVGKGQKVGLELDPSSVLANLALDSSFCELP